MPKYGIDSKDSVYLNVTVDGQLCKYAYAVDTDEGWVCRYLVEPAPTSKFPERVKVQRDKTGHALTETVWGKVVITDVRTGKEPQ